MRIGIIGSSGGSVFNEVARILKTVPSRQDKYCVITDRPCGLEEICVKNHIEHHRIQNPDNMDFSREAKHIFDQFGGVDVILLFFLRLVTKELFTYFPCVNLHPSLLPAFKGFNPIQAALKEKVRFFGCTLHLVNDKADSGMIIAQASMPIDTSDTEETLNKYSFIQKVYLSLLLTELIETDSLKFLDKNTIVELAGNLPGSDRFNPCLRNPHLLKQTLQLQKREKVEVIV